MIEIYGSSNCAYCTKAKELAESYNMRYTYIDVLEENNSEIFMSKFPDAKTVPQITWHGRHIGGYTEFAKEIEETRSYGDGKI